MIGSPAGAGHGAPVALVLAGPAPSASNLIGRLAAAAGFRPVVSDPRSTEPSVSGIVVRRGTDGVGASARVLAGTTTLWPALVVPLDHSPLGLARARALVSATAAWWGHCEALVPGLLPPAGAEVVAEAVLELDPTTASGCAAVAGVGRTEVAEVLRGIGPGAWSGASPVLHRMCAPVALWRDAAGRTGLSSLLAPGVVDQPPVADGIRAWLEHLAGRVIPAPAFALPGPVEDAGAADWPFPSLFGTSPTIDTVARDASSHYVDPALVAVGTGGNGDAAHSLLGRLARERRSGPVAGGAADGDPGGHDGRRVVPPGVGRACLVPGLQVDGAPELVDFTVLGVGLTPYSEGGYVEIGRDVDGKASLFRAWHRKRVADALEANGCRSARVVAILDSSAAAIEMPDGTRSPAALVVRAFRSELRVKQLDPLICCLHSVQHTPLVGAFLAEEAVARARARGVVPGDPWSDELLARTIEAQHASQESLRDLLERPVDPADDTWPGLVHAVRLGVIDDYVDVVLPIVLRRLEVELHLAPGSISRSTYVEWFATSVGRQVATWRELRFLHDYHHPGVARWKPGHLYTLGENNVTVAAEFPDLDTGVFVDDPEAELAHGLQLAPADVRFLRERFLLLHRRDVVAARTVVRTLALLVDPARPHGADDAVGRFEEAYRGA